MAARLPRTRTGARWQTADAPRLMRSLMRLLVTGGAGFIGSAFVARRLAATDDSIVVLDLLTYAGNRANLAEVESDAAFAGRFEFMHGDICDAALVAHLAEVADAIVNFAAETHVDRSIAAADAFLRTGVIGVNTLLEAARTRQGRRAALRVVQVSTDEVYGSVETGYRTEDDALAPRSPYAAARRPATFSALPTSRRTAWTS